MDASGTLIFFCGKMGAGKSTMSREMAEAENVLLLSEDEWLMALYPNEINDLADYVKYSTRLKKMVKPHVQTLLNSGVSVVLDFPGNTKAQRAWFKQIISNSQVAHKLIYIEASDTLCLTQIHMRRQSQPERAKIDTEKMFHRVTQYFEPPTENEGFNVEVRKRDDV